MYVCIWKSLLAVICFILWLLGCFVVTSLLMIVVVIVILICSLISSAFINQRQIYGIINSEISDISNIATSDLAFNFGNASISVEKYEFSLISLNCTDGLWFQTCESKVESWYSEVNNPLQLRFINEKLQVCVMRVTPVVQRGVVIAPVDKPTYYTAKQYCQSRMKTFKSDLQCDCKSEPNSVCRITTNQNITIPDNQYTELYLESSTGVKYHSPLEARTSSLYQKAYQATDGGLHINVTVGERKSFGLISENVLVSTTVTSQCICQQFTKKQRAHYLTMKKLPKAYTQFSEYPLCHYGAAKTEECETKQVTIKNYQYHSMLYIGSTFYLLWRYMFIWTTAYPGSCETLLCPSNTSQVPRWEITESSFMGRRTRQEHQWVPCENIYFSNFDFQPWFDAVYACLVMISVFFYIKWSHKDICKKCKSVKSSALRILNDIRTFLSAFAKRVNCQIRSDYSQVTVHVANTVPA